MAMTGEITTVGEGWLVGASMALTRWGRKRRVRANLADVYFGEGSERRADLERRLLLDCERRAAHRELDRITTLSKMYRGF